MLELIIIALASTVVAVTLVWLYRKLTEFRGSSLVSLSNDSTSLKLSAQQGYVSLHAPDAERPIMRKTSGRKSSKPWGW